jgi:hypothetical protein
VTAAPAVLAAVNVVAVNILDARSLLTAFGVVGIFVVLFAETGLLVGFFLPGDSLLFTAGLLSSVSGATAVSLPLPWVLLAAAGGTLSGAQVGDLIGRRAAILSRHPEITVWIHADDATHPLAVRELAAGAAGVLAHQTEPDQLLAVLRSGAAAAQDGDRARGHIPAAVPSAGTSRRPCDHRCSMRPNRHTRSAASHETTNRATMP